MTGIPAWCGSPAHGCHDHIMRVLADVIERLERIERTEKENIVSGLTDLNTAISNMQAEWTTFLADLQSVLGNEDSDAAVEQAAQLVAAQTAAMQAADPVTGTTATAPDAAPETAPSGDVTADAETTPAPE